MIAETDAPKKTKYAKNNKTKGSWFNWFVPILLVLLAIATLLFYPEPKKSTSSPATIKQSSITKTEFFVAKNLATQLVTTFFNGSEEDRTEQIHALENTLNHLNSNTSDTTKNILDALKNSNINASITALTTLANKQENLRESAKTWVNIGNIQNLTSAEQALQAYQKASEFDSDNSDAWNRQGHIHRHLKQFDLAEKAYKRVQALANQSTSDQALSLSNFGLLNQTKGDFKSAEEAYSEALDIYTKIGNDAGIASTNENLASLYKNWNVFDRAEKHYLIAFDNHEKLNNFQAMATIHTSLGSLYQSMKKTKKAQSHYEKALQIRQENSFNENISELYNILGSVAEQNGQIEKSKHYFEKSLTLKKGKRPISAADQFGKLATENRSKKNFLKAESYHKKAIEIYQENNNRNGVISQKINLGFLYKVWNKPEQACNTWKETYSLLSNSDNRIERIRALLQTNCQ